ncbi:hypothetical protein ACHQM5_016283 [Ranunculus cassubicifolius]
MVSSPMAFLFFSFILLISTITTSALDPACSSSDSELSIVHIYGKCSPFAAPKREPWFNTVVDMAKKDPARLAYLSSKVVGKTAVPIASGQALNTGNYLVRAKIGTPGQVVFMVLDTSNDIASVPCVGCLGCSSTMFSSNKSVTYGSLDCTMAQCTLVRGLSCPQAGPIPCQFNQSYGGDSSFAATLAHDSLRLALDIVPNYAFGCINAVAGSNIPPQGLLGMGRGPMSLLSQSGSLYSGVFSYCLPSFRSINFSGSLKLGPKGQPATIKTTPLLSNPRRSSLYYVDLTGISVGKVLIPIAPELLAFNPTTGAGTIIDSGTVITRFKQPVYTALRNEFIKQLNGAPISSLGAFDTCFTGVTEALTPVVTFHFTGMDLELPIENTLIHSRSGPLACLSMAAAPDNVNAVLNVIANLQQQNLRILFDLTNSKVGIARESCN